jgi:hypothetical protein
MAGAKQKARPAGFAVRVFSAAIVVTVPYSIARQMMDRNSAPYHLLRGCGVLFFMIGVSPLLCAGPGSDSSRSPKGALPRRGGPRRTPHRH